MFFYLYYLSTQVVSKKRKKLRKILFLHNFSNAKTQNQEGELAKDENQFKSW